MAEPRLKSNFAILIAGDALGKLVSFVVFSRLARVLEPEAYGRLEPVVAVVVLGALVIEAGLSPFGARAVAQDAAAAPRILGRVLAVRALILAAVLAIVAAAALLLGGTRGPLLLLALPMLVPRAFLCEWLFQGRREMATVTATMLLEPLVSLVLTFAFIHEPAHLWRVPLLLAISVATVALAQQAVARSRGVAADLRHGFESAADTVRASLPLGLSAVAWAVRFYSPVLALWLAATSTETGVFGAAHRLVVSVHAVVWLYFFNLLPGWSQAALVPGALEGGVRRSLPVTLAGGVLLAGALWVLAPFMTSRFLFGSDYAASIGILRILAIGPALAWISGNFRFALIARGALADDLRANAAGAATAVAMFFALGAALDATTAAWTFCAAEAVTLVTAWWRWRRAAAARSTAPPPPSASPR